MKDKPFFATQAIGPQIGMPVLMSLLREAKRAGYVAVDVTPDETIGRSRIVALITMARQNYWLDQPNHDASGDVVETSATSAPKPKRAKEKAAPVASLCTVTAAETNEWLATLPRVEGDI
jgi:hypothetical protein